MDVMQVGGGMRVVGFVGERDRWGGLGSWVAYWRSLVDVMQVGGGVRVVGVVG